MQITHKPGRTMSLQEQLEMDLFVAELRRRNPPKPRPVKPDGMTDAEFILSLQAPSTRATLMRTDDEQAAWLARPLLTGLEAAANKEAYAAYQKDPSPENYKKMIGQRDLSINEIHLAESARRRSKNELGSSVKSATTDITRERAISAVIYTPPAKVTPKEVEDRAVNLVQYKSEPLKEVWVELPWYQALWHWVKGNKVRQDDKV